jgi:hypothetical protein
MSAATGVFSDIPRRFVAAGFVRAAWRSSHSYSG